MKVVFINEYYPPFTPGGGEWSTFYLAKQLENRGVGVVVVTPDYGKTEYTRDGKVFDDQGINVRRFPLPLGSQMKTFLSPIWFNNPFFWLYSGFWIWKVAKNENAEVLHVHGKYSIPGAWFAARVLNIPVVVTFREKMILCPYNRCLSGNALKACNLYQFISRDMRWYYSNYVKRGFLNLVKTVVSGLFGYFSMWLLKGIAKRCNCIVAISRHDKKVFENNDFSSVEVIYNSINFNGVKKPAYKNNLIVYAGKISLGKGVPLLLSAFAIVAKKLPKIRLELVGSGDPLEFPLALRDRIKFAGAIPHFKLLEMMKRANVVVMPSITVEAFGRVALEALSVGTPAVVTNIGGLPEIVADGRYGYVVNPNVNDLAEGIVKAIKNTQKLRKNIQRDYSRLTKKFGEDNISNYIKIYYSLIRSKK